MAFFLLALAVTMLGTSQFFTSTMKWQHAIVLEPICETNTIIIFLPAERTAFLPLLLTCFTLLPFYLLLSRTESF